mgnify:CR=1 FL=1
MGYQVLAKEAPMSLSEQYKLEQANEIGSNIASCIALRQVYIEENLAFEQAKKDCLAKVPDNKKCKHLKEALLNNKNITIDGDKIKFMDSKNKPVELSVSEVGEQTVTMLTSAMQHKKRINEVLSISEKDKDGKYKQPLLGDVMGEYFAKVKSGEINPMDSKGFDNEMAQIGKICAKNWQETRAYSKDIGSFSYDGQCESRAKEFFTEHNYNEVSSNGCNYDRAVSAALTVGGYDFSKHVKPELTCNNQTIQKADKMIESGAIKLDVGINCLHTVNDNDVNRNFAFNELTKGKKKVGDSPDIISQPVKWTAQDAAEYKKLIAEIRKGSVSYSEEHKQAIENAIKRTGLEEQKVGSTISENQLKTFTRLCNTVLESNKNDDNINTNMTEAEMKLRQFYEKKQIQSISPITLKKWQEKCNSLKGWSKQNMAQFNPARVKEHMVAALDRREYGKSAKEFTVREGHSAQYNGQQTSYVNMADLSQPFLVEQSYKQKANEAIERIKSGKQQVYQTPEQPQQQNQRIVAQQNVPVNQGR